MRVPFLKSFSLQAPPQHIQSPKREGPYHISLLSSEAAGGKSVAAQSLSNHDFLSSELMLQNKGSKFKAHVLQRSQKSEAVGFCKEKIRQASQTRIPEMRLKLVSLNKGPGSVLTVRVRRGYTY